MASVWSWVTSDHRRASSRCSQARCSMPHVHAPACRVQVRQRLVRTGTPAAYARWRGRWPRSALAADSSRRVRCQPLPPMRSTSAACATCSSRWRRGHRPCAARAHVLGHRHVGYSAITLEHQRGTTVGQVQFVGAAPARCAARPGRCLPARRSCGNDDSCRNPLVRRGIANSPSRARRGRRRGSPRRSNAPSACHVKPFGRARPGSSGSGSKRPIHFVTAPAVSRR